MTYPDGINALVNVNAGDTLAAGGHAARHNSVNTALDEVKDLLNAGDAGQVLIAAGSAAPPIWAPVAAGGKILQIVRATDTTERSTTSTSFVDVTGMTVTITPQKDNSAVLIIAAFFGEAQWSTGDEGRSRYQITDNSNNGISGFQDSSVGTVNITGQDTRVVQVPVVGMAYATPASTSAQTYKLRFRSIDANSTNFVRNNLATGQMYAIEVSA